jgi:trehalose utilization protein
MNDEIRITVWNEFRHERKPGHEAGKVYPQGIHAAIAQALSRYPEFTVRTATLDEPEHGLTQEVLDNTDVLTWWGHCAHKEVHDDVVARVHARVLAGMGLIVLHSGHFSKIFTRLMGTTCALKWRVHPEENARLWVIEPGHPIAQGLPDHVEIPHDEMYGERFDIPAPDTLVFATWFKGGELFRSGCCFHRGNGKVFYFSAGHETFPVYYQPEIQKVLANACRWARPVITQTYGCVRHEPTEKLG